MPRPSKGAAARTIKAGLWISAAEEEHLVLRYGSTGKGLRHALNALLATRTDIVDGTKTKPGVNSSHRHRRGALLRTIGVGGEMIAVYQCEGCDKELR